MGVIFFKNGQMKKMRGALVIIGVAEKGKKFRYFHPLVLYEGSHVPRVRVV